METVSRGLVSGVEESAALVPIDAAVSCAHMAAVNRGKIMLPPLAVFKLASVEFCVDRPLVYPR